MYNGGGLLYKEREICKLRKKCDPNKWFNNAAYDINREHVRYTTKIRLFKYKQNYERHIVMCSDYNGTKKFILKY